MQRGKRATIVQIITDAFALVMISTSFSTAVTFQDSSTGFSITLPDGWKDSTLPSKNHIFLADPQDSVHRTNIQVRRYDYDPTIFESEKDWCISMSMAYKILVESDPFYGHIYALDSTTQDGLFAMYANSEHTNNDLDIRSEIIRWTAKNRCGYEVLVNTDTLDMYINYKSYQSILDSFHVIGSTNILVNSAGFPISMSNPGAPIFR